MTLSQGSFNGWQAVPTESVGGVKKLTVRLSTSDLQKFRLRSISRFNSPLVNTSTSSLLMESGSTMAQSLWLEIVAATSITWLKSKRFRSAFIVNDVNKGKISRALHQKLFAKAHYTKKTFHGSAVVAVASAYAFLSARMSACRGRKLNERS